MTAVDTDSLPAIPSGGLEDVTAMLAVFASILSVHPIIQSRSTISYDEDAGYLKIYIWPNSLYRILQWIPHILYASPALIQISIRGSEFLVNFLLVRE